jgi:hypothetical protein
VQPGLDRGQRHGRVQVVGRHDAHGLNIAALDQLAVVAGNVRRAVALGEGLGARDIDVAHRAHNALLGQQVAGVPVGHAAGF